MRSRIIKWIRYYFGISRTEANGVLVLIILMILVIFVPVIIRSGLLVQPEISKDESKLLDSLTAILEENILAPDSIDNQINEQVLVQPFPFDPNTASREEFLNLGLNEELSNRILKYRDNGGVFRTKEDLLKIYGLGRDIYSRLAPYTHITSREVSERSAYTTKDTINRYAEKVGSEINHFDINRIDSTELLYVNGIGKVLAGRIVRFRKSLGGFVNFKQLNEVYGLDTVTLNRLVEQAFIDENFKPERIKINDLPADSIAKHPYIDYRAARVIVAYREQHGRFNDPGDIMKIKIFKEEWLDRITPYLTFQ